MPLQMLCDTCGCATLRNYVAKPLIIRSARIELIIGANVDGKPAGILCAACVVDIVRHGAPAPHEVPDDVVHHEASA